jgi:hypothetical protein
MLLESYFKKAICISLLGHLVAFGFFNFSFGRRLAPADYPAIASFGAILSGADLRAQEQLLRPEFSRKGFLVSRSPFPRSPQEHLALVKGMQRPPIGLKLSDQKLHSEVFRQVYSLPTSRRQPSVMLYPQLPYNFLLYFRDRQTVFIELFFKLERDSLDRSSVVIKRKVSSGNIEADLLAMRYLSHYLFIQQHQFILDCWQTVKIELSAAKDSR